MPLTNSDMNNHSGLCYSCKAKAKDQKIENQLNEIQQTLSLEARIRRIEKYIIQHSENHPRQEIFFR